MDHIVDLIDALAWPIATVILALIFRREFRSVVRRLTALKYKDFQADFGQDLLEVEKQLKAMAAEAQGQTEEDAESLSRYERLMRITEMSPRAAIMEAWRDIEVTTKQVTDAYGISVGGHIAGIRAIRDLVRKGVLPDSVGSVYERMRKLRARAAHAADFAIDPEEAVRYIETAHDFYTTLQFLLKQAPIEPEKTTSPSI